MIFGSIENFDKEKSVYASAITMGLDYLSKTDFIAMPIGRYDLSEGIFALVQEYQTESKAKRRPESHVDYLDVQYIVQGEEIISYAYLTEDCRVEENQLPKNDMIFYSKKIADEVDLNLSAGMFAVLFPWDVHRPCVTKKVDSKVKKVVLKIPVSAVLR
ncbi:YhcH/YjgK/YiaL family protein [Sporomusaceae bacterium BoRhaA]|uniref:YhcH/YjgK/YiaL family protein n=1 Tax=Pelorhabdus rhamnosifermentans TaxID=2772457 RepID=UPI001C05EEA4|nr:YhcH/YjgK/YiaL family protein [Pelorhabdus rhamnosifermentans]MBU2699236.1 YhcH/YjgK/YiaL family protein [Pelorhabdus rhamnosifermentans]